MFRHSQAGTYNPIKALTGTFAFSDPFICYCKHDRTQNFPRHKPVTHVKRLTSPGLPTGLHPSLGLRCASTKKGLHPEGWSPIY